MRLTVRGYGGIVIPEDLTPSSFYAFGAETPYLAKVLERLKRPSYREGKLPAKLTCLERLRHRAFALGGYKTLCEPLAGIGLTARLLASTGHLYLNEWDQDCRKVLHENFGPVTSTITDQDAMKAPITEADLVFFDFNNFTLKRYVEGGHKEPLQRAFSSAKRFLILNDCSVFYFRYGEKSFANYEKYVGKRIASNEEYFRAAQKILCPKGWHMIHVAYFRDSAFILFSRVEAPLKIEFVQDPRPLIGVGLL